MAWFETVASQTRYVGFSTVRVDTVRLPGGGEVEREVVEHVPAVAVVPLFDDGDVLLVRQYRHPLGRDLLELPAGIMDVDGEAAVDCARRELVEETGHVARNLEQLTTLHLSPGWSTEHIHIFVADDLTPASGADDFVAVAEEAHMEVVRLPLDVAVEQARQGVLTNASTVAGLLLAAHRQH